MGRGGVWRARFPVVIENHTHSALEGAPVALEVGAEAGQAPLAGAEAGAVRVVDGRCAQLLFRLQAPGQSEAFISGAIPAGATLVLPAVCGPVTSVTYTVYFDNPKAWALADSLSSKPVRNSPDVLARVGAVERLELREEGGNAAWVTAGGGGFWRHLSGLFPGSGGRDGWHHRTPVFVTNLNDTDETNVLAAADLISAAHGVVAPRFLLTFNGKPVATSRLGDRLLFSCSAPARSVLTYYLYVADTGKRPGTAKVSASALGGELPSDQVLSERFGTADAGAFSDLLGGLANLMQNPGFERGGDLPEAWEASAAGQGVSYSLASSVGDGARYARLTVSPSAPAGWYGWRQRVPVKSGHSYLYGASVACEGLDGTARMTVSLRDRADRLVGYHITSGQTVGGDAPWTPMFGMVTVPQGASKLLMSLTMNVHGTLKHDNAFLVECREAEVGDPELPAMGVGDWRVWPVEPVVKVFRETPPPRKNGPSAVALARNEEEALQLAVRVGRDIPDLRVEADPPRNRAGRELAAPSVGWVETVPVDHRTGYYYLETPEWELKQPTHEGVSDGWAGWWPDPIRPDASGSLAANRTQAVWLSFKTAADTPAGLYRGEVRFVAGGTVLETVPYAVTVWDFALPEKPSFTAVYDVRLTSLLWRSDGLSDAARRERVIRFMASKKICPDSVGANLRFTRDGQGHVVCDFSEYDREATHYFDELNFPTSYMPGFFSIFNWEHLPKPFLKEKPYEGEYPYPGVDRTKLRPAYKQAYQECLRLFWEHVKAKGWSDRLVLYISDEPFLDKKPIVDQMAALCDMIHEVDPKIRIYCSTWRHCPGWNGRLDIWGAGHYGCFLVEEMKARQAAGERVWFTTDGQLCLDTPFCAVERLLPHYGFQYGVETYEFWGVSWLTYNPWKFGWHRFYQNSVTPDKSRYVRFPSGDGCLLYPGAPVGVEGPVTTVRLEAVRDGVEDYEYLRLLKTLAGTTGDQEASVLLKAYSELTGIPNAGGRYSTKILPDPSRLAELRLRAGGVIERLHCEK